MEIEGVADALLISADHSGHEAHVHPVRIEEEAAVDENGEDDLREDELRGES